MTSEFAAVAAAAFFSLSSTFFTLAGRRVGPSAVNRARLLLAAVLALGLHWIVRGEPLPSSATGAAWLWLVLSGVIGLALGDASLFHAYVRIGAALSMLIFSTTPVFTTLLGLVFLGETLTDLEWTGIAVTLLGVGWVVSEPRRRDFLGAGRSYGAGILFAFGGALGQALGLLTAKLGLAEGVATQSANLVRLLGAAAAVWVAALVAGFGPPHPPGLPGRPQGRGLHARGHCRRAALWCLAFSRRHPRRAPRDCLDVDGRSPRSSSSRSRSSSFPSRSATARFSERP